MIRVGLLIFFTGAPHHISNSSHQKVREHHKVHDPVINAFCGRLIAFALQHGAAHGTLGLDFKGEEHQ